jgi:AcrR family transcriptional regulator
MPRRSAAHALQTRDAIVERAVDLASVEGLEGVTIGRLAGDLTMSKAGVIGHFGSKEALQLAAIESASARFREAVWQRAEHVTPGLPRLRAVCKAWLDYIEVETFPGGCFLSAASFEFDDREGPVREAIAAALGLWHAALRADVKVAVKAGALPAGTVPDQVAFELEAIALGAGQARRLRRDPKAGLYARRAMERVLAT